MLYSSTFTVFMFSLIQLMPIERYSIIHARLHKAFLSTNSLKVDLKKVGLKLAIYSIVIVTKTKINKNHQL